MVNQMANQNETQVKITTQSKEQQLAQIVKDKCIQVALAGYEDAAMNGLCCEGAWEAAISALRLLDLEMVLKSS